MKKLISLLVSFIICIVAYSQSYEYHNDFSAEPSHFIKTGPDTTYQLTISDGILNIGIKKKSYMMNADSLFLKFPSPLDLTFNPKLTLTLKSDSSINIMAYLIDDKAKLLISSGVVYKSSVDTTIVLDYSPMLMYNTGFNFKSVTKVAFDIMKMDYAVLNSNVKINNLSIGGVMSDSCALLRSIKIGADSIHSFNPYNYLYSEDFIGNNPPELIAVPFDNRANIEYNVVNEEYYKYVEVKVTPYKGSTTRTYLVNFQQMAKLSGILVNGKAIEMFNSQKTYYDYNLGNPDALPNVTASLVDPFSHFEIEQAKTFPGTAQIHVWSADSTSNNYYSVYFSKTDSVFTPIVPSYYYKVKNAVLLPILTGPISLLQHYKSYKFEFNYDETILEYKGFDLNNTISKGATVNVDSSTPGKLIVTSSKGSEFSGVGSLILLKFNSIQTGESPIIINDFYYNESPVYNINTSPITISNIIYGDVDNDNEVQAYDAALILQASVGINPFPSQDLEKVLSWFLQVADVDNDLSILANDASLVLRYSAKLISIFPIQTKGSLVNNNLSLLDATFDDNTLVIRSKGDVYALNAFIPVQAGVSSSPVFANGISAYHSTEEGLSVGLITSKSFGKGEELVRIQLNPNLCAGLNIRCNVNGVNQILTIKNALQLNSTSNSTLKSYPNPVLEKLTIEAEFINNQTDLELYSSDGRKMNVDYVIGSRSVELNTANLRNGFYFVKMVQKDGSVSTIRFVKK